MKDGLMHQYKIKVGYTAAISGDLKRMYITLLTISQQYIILITHATVSGSFSASLINIILH